MFRSLRQEQLIFWCPRWESGSWVTRWVLCLRVSRILSVRKVNKLCCAAKLRLIICWLREGGRLRREWLVYQTRFFGKLFIIFLSRSTRYLLCLSRRDQLGIRKNLGVFYRLNSRYGLFRCLIELCGRLGRFYRGGIDFSIVHENWTRILFIQ